MKLRHIAHVVLTTALLSPLSASAGTEEKAVSTDKSPQTAQGHYDMAKKYEAKAAEYKADAETHKEMLAEYTRRNSVPNLTSKLGKDPWIDRMKAHCERYIANAEALAKEATAFADYHRMRGKEMAGK